MIGPAGGTTSNRTERVRPSTHHTPPFTVQLHRPSDLGIELVAQWHELEMRSLESNAYLSPSFVLPAIEHLTGADRVHVVTVHRPEAGDEGLCGVGVFQYHRASKAFPLPHLTAYRSIHSFLTGVLVDRDQSEQILDAMLDFIATGPLQVQGVLWSSFPTSGPLGTAMDSVVERRRWRWHVLKERERAFLDLAELRRAHRWDGHISSNRRKKYRRSLRGLEAKGALGWRLSVGNDVDSKQIAEFLRLEDLGWKAEQGSSILANEQYRSFFASASEQFAARGDLMLTELLLDDAVIAATCNFRSGGDGFAFKIGWDPTLREHSPGIVNEIMLLEHAHQGHTEVAAIDSGANEDSFINAYWPGRKTLANSALCFSRFGSSVLCLAVQIRNLKEWLLGRYRHHRPTS